MASPAPRYRIGIDLGGTKIEAIALARRWRASSLRRRQPTPQDDYRGTVAAIAGLVASGGAGAGRDGAPSASACPAPSRRPPGW